MADKSTEHVLRSALHEDARTRCVHCFDLLGKPDRFCKVAGKEFSNCSWFIWIGSCRDVREHRALCRTELRLRELRREPLLCRSYNRRVERATDRELPALDSFSLES